MKNDSQFTIHNSRWKKLFVHFTSCMVHGAFFFLFSCANQVAPSGGDKDVKPPKILKSVPENYSTNIKTHDITITFDEYVQLKDISTQLIVSPPLKYPVQTRLRKKSLL